MNNQIVRRITLSGNDAIIFANSLFRPSDKAIEKYREIMDSINATISINKDCNGFDADIVDLDLSFLEEFSMDKKISVDVDFRIDLKSELVSTDGQIKSSVMTVKRNNGFVSSKGNAYFPWAA